MRGSDPYVDETVQLRELREAYEDGLDARDREDREVERADLDRELVEWQPQHVIDRYREVA